MDVIEVVLWWCCGGGGGGIVVEVEVVLAGRWCTWSRWSGVEPGDRYSSFRWSFPVGTSSRSYHCAAKDCGKIPQSQPGPRTDRQRQAGRETDRQAERQRETGR